MRRSFCVLVAVFIMLCGVSHESMAKKIKSELERNLSLYENKALIIELRRKTQEYIELNCDEDTLQSSRNYFENIKLIDTIGENSDSGSEGDNE